MTPENVGAEFYHTICDIAESENEEGTLWVGAEDGLMHLTRDGGENWSDIAPPHRGEAMINSIGLSPQAEGTAYLAVTGYKLNDFRPYIYKTTNHGRSWKRIDRGIPEAAFVRVVREDPVRQGLLYAGTEKGMFVSYNDGGDWQSLDLNLPAVPITDLRARDDGLVVATQGRSFWVLDDLFVLRQADDRLKDKALHVYTPPLTEMGRPGGDPADFEGANPPADVPLYFYVKDEPAEDAELKIEIFDAGGSLVRRMTNRETAQDRCRIGNMDPRRPFEIEYPEVEQGLNRLGWDLQSDEVQCIDNILLQAGYEGPSVTPGNYTARITLGTVSDTTDCVVAKDPRSIAADTQIRE